MKIENETITFRNAVPDTGFRKLARFGTGRDQHELG